MVDNCITDSMKITSETIHHFFIKKKRAIVNLGTSIWCIISNLATDLPDILRKEKPLLLNCWCNYKKGIVQPRNFGDDLNFFLFRELTSNPIRVSQCSIWGYFNTLNYLCIGSILHLANKNTIIWGAGGISKNSVVPRVKQICAVRGPLTRQLLLTSGQHCPEVYGDPALLVSRIYHPQTSKKYKYGIIPNANDEAKLKDLLLPINMTVISFVNYSNWRLVLDKISECECILSSSLHGLIISDSYEIPNVWICFDYISNIGGSFKFLDYFASVDRHQMEPIKVTSVIDNPGFKIDDFYEHPRLDLDKLIASCPFEIKEI